MSDFDHVKITDLPYEVDQITHVELIRIKLAEGSTVRYDVRRDLYNPTAYTTVKSMVLASGDDYNDYTAYRRNYCTNRLTACTLLQETTSGDSFVILGAGVDTTKATTYLNDTPEILPRRHVKSAAQVSTAQTQVQSLGRRQLRSSFEERERTTPTLRAKPRNTSGSTAAQSGGPFAPEPAGIAPTLTSASSITIEADQVTSYFITTEGTKPVTVSVTSPNAYVQYEEGVIYLNPSSSDLGPGSFTITALNEYGGDVMEVEVEVVAAGSRPVITSDTNITAEVGSDFEYQITASGVGTLTVDVSGLPAFLSYDDGVITGIVTTAGTYAFDIAVSNEYGSTTSTVTLYALTSIGDKPRILTRRIVVGLGYEATEAILLAGKTPLRLETGTLPSYISFADNALTIAANAPLGDHYVDVTASNAYGVDRQLITVVVSNEAPAITSPSTITMTAGASRTYMMQANGAKPLRFSITGAPSFVTVIGTVLTLNPSIASVGTFTFTLTATNDFGSASKVVSITVNGAAPVITSSAILNVPAGSTKRYTMSAYGSGTIAFDVIGLPTYATREGNTLIFSPSFSDVGTTVTVVASNAYGSSNVKLVVTTTSAPTITSGDSVTLAAGQTTTYTLVASGTAILNYAAVSVPSFASLYRNVLTIAPSSGDVGSFTATLKVSNIYGSDEIDVTITVVGVAPTITSSSVISVRAGATQTYTLTSSGSTPKTVTYRNLPDFVTQSGATLTIRPSITLNDVTYTIPVTVTNSLGSDSATLSLSVVGIPPTITSANSIVVNSDNPIEYEMTAVGSNDITFTTSTLPTSDIVIVRSGNVLTITAETVPFTEEVTITATNSKGTSTITLVIESVGVAPTITGDDEITIDAYTDYLYVFEVTGNPAPLLTYYGDTDIILDFAQDFTSGTCNFTINATALDPEDLDRELRIVATNEYGEYTFILTVHLVGVPPVITSAEEKVSGAEDGSTYEITSSGGPATYTVEYSEITGLGTDDFPDWITFDDDHTITFGSTSIQTVRLLITATNAFGSDQITLTVYVVSKPVITSDLTITRAVGAAISYTITATSAAIAGPLTFSIISDDDTLTVNPSTGVLSGTFDTSSTYYYYIRATSAAGYDEQLLEITVPVPAAWITFDDTTPTILVEGYLEVGFTYVGYPATITMDPELDFVTIVDYGFGSGVLVFEPEIADALDSPYSVDMVIDNGIQDVEPLTITVTVDPASIDSVDDTTPSVTVGTPVVINFTYSGTTPTVSLDGAPAFATLDDNGDGTGTITFNPVGSDAQLAPHEFDLVVDNSALGSNGVEDRETIQVTVSIIPASITQEPASSVGPPVSPPAVATLIVFKWVGTEANLSLTGNVQPGMSIVGPSGAAGSTPEPAPANSFIRVAIATPGGPYNVQVQVSNVGLYGGATDTSTTCAITVI